MSIEEKLEVPKAHCLFAGSPQYIRYFDNEEKLRFTTMSNAFCLVEGYDCPYHHAERGHALCTYSVRRKSYDNEKQSVSSRPGRNSK